MADAFPGHRHTPGQSVIGTPDGCVVFDYDDANAEGLAKYVGVSCGGGDAAIAAIEVACRVLGLRGLDSQTGRILDFGPATAGSARAFREFRDRSLPGATDRPTGEGG